VSSAKQQLEAGDCDFASSRAYYAVFYVLEAVLLTKGLSFSKHSGVISAFNHHFVKTGIFPKEFSGWLTRLFRERQMADYEFDLSINAEEAQKDIESSQVILKAIQTYLTQQGFEIG
jgi:uncharacterized protein (UPF0332 family)